MRPPISYIIGGKKEVATFKASFFSARNYATFHRQYSHRRRTFAKPFSPAIVLLSWRRPFDMSHHQSLSLSRSLFHDDEAPFLHPRKNAIKTARSSSRNGSTSSSTDVDYRLPPDCISISSTLRNKVPSCLSKISGKTSF